MFVLRAVDVARFAVEEVSRGRRTWSQIYFATGSCVKSLQRTCKAWMQLHMPPKAFACVSKRGSLTRDLNSCSIYKKKKINTVLPIIISTAGNFLIYLFHSQIPSLFPSLYSLLSQSKNKFQTFKSDGQWKMQVQAWCVCTLHDGAESKYLREHILCAVRFWHCSAPGCEHYLDGPAGDCKYLNVYRAFSSYIQTNPPPPHQPHSYFPLWSAGCVLADVGFCSGCNRIIVWCICLAICCLKDSSKLFVYL